LESLEASFLAGSAKVWDPYTPNMASAVAEVNITKLDILNHQKK